IGKLFHAAHCIDGAAEPVCCKHESGREPHPATQADAPARFGCCSDESGGAKRMPMNRMIAESTSAIRVTEKPSRKVDRSEMAPIIVGDNASPRRWMVKRFTPIAVARIGAATEFTIAAFSGPVLRNRKNSAPASDRNIQLGLP